MKRIYRISILTAAIIASVGSAVAQDLRTAYFLDDFKWRHDMNPAFGNRQSYVALPFSNINVGIQGSFGVDNFLFENPRWGQPGEKRTVTFMHPDITYDQSVGKLKNGLKTRVDFRETIIGLGFRAFHGYNTLDVNVKGMAGVSFPKSFLESVAKSDVDALFQESVNTILSINPGLRPGMLEYIIGIILADREIGEKEVNFVYNMGKSLGLSVQEISVLFAGMVQRNFNPSLDAIS